jgi:hypothetical protein
MKSRVFLILALALILITSLAVVGCGGSSGATFKATELTFSANPAEVGTAITISATITNSGASGTCNATLIVGSANVETKSVEVAEKATQTVTFTYTPTTAGTFNVSITPGYQAKGTLGVIQTPKGYWDIQYDISEGSRVVFNYSLVGGKPYHKLTDLVTGDGKVTIRVNKTVVNGVRDIILLSSGWQIKSLFVPDVSPGADMDVVMSLTKDAPGKLYVQDGKADVDMSSVSSRTTKPKQTDTQGTGTNSPAGSLLVATVLQGNAKTSIGATIILPFGLTFTTGHIINTVSIPSSKFNGATLVSDGAAFAKSGTLTVGGQKLPDYVGTAGTITTTGTGDCLGITLVGMGIDFQVEIKLVLTPVSVTSGQ